MIRVLRANAGECWVAWAAAEFVQAAVESYVRTGAFHVVVPGGSTPRAVFTRIARDFADGSVSFLHPDQLRAKVELRAVWRAAQVYFGDERAVSPQHSDSNYRMVEESLLRHLPIPSGQVHRMEGELELTEAARRYSEVVGTRLGNGTDGSGLPFDLVCLGLGTDGHAASLIPGGRLDFVAEPWVGVGPAPNSPARSPRLTLTAAALRATRHCMFWVTGSGKAGVVHAALHEGGKGTIVPEVLPSAGVVTWLLDDGSAVGLEGQCGRHT